jgi:hypothetical protein
VKRKKRSISDKILERMRFNAQAIIDHAERRVKGPLRSAAYDFGCAILADVANLDAAIRASRARRKESK